MLHVVKTIP